jgi:hypothetical protein
MNEITVKKLARDIGISVENLITQLNDANVTVKNEDDTVTGKQQLQLMKQNKLVEKSESKKNDITLDDICNAKGLLELNDLLTQLMAKQQLQPLIKEPNLGVVIDSIIELSNKTEVDQKLLAAAMLGRLAAVARGRENQVLERVKEVISHEPPSLDSLSEQSASSDDKEMDLSKTKQYAAQSFRFIDAAWLSEYCIREAINIDAAENARRELLVIALNRYGNFSDWLISISDNTAVLRAIDNPDARLKRVRRILDATLEVVKSWQGELGIEPGAALAKCFASLANGKLVDVDQETLYDVVDSGLAMLVRLIELRFSFALYGQTYSVIEKGKVLFEVGMWGRFLDKSSMIARVRTDLLESALVLARQNRTDSSLMGAILTCYSSTSQISAAVKRHFSQALDLEPDVYKWWQSASKNAGDRRDAEHKVGNNEDEHIGLLLIEVEYAKETMEKLNRAVAPMLEISDPVLAETVKRAALNYQDMAQITRRLARMRKLTKSGLLGQKLEYNPREHEMQGGHQAGIRHVKVIRDGIRKEFNDKTKTLVKPLVKSEE